MPSINPVDFLFASGGSSILFGLSFCILTEYCMMPKIISVTVFDPAGINGNSKDDDVLVS